MASRAIHLETANSLDTSSFLNAYRRFIGRRRPLKNLEVGDLVIVKDIDTPRNQWKLARIVETYPETDDLVRKVRIVLADDTSDDQGRSIRPVSYLDRPVHKLVLLLSRDKYEDQGFPTRSHALNRDHNDAWYLADIS